MKNFCIQHQRLLASYLTFQDKTICKDTFKDMVISTFDGNETKEQHNKTQQTLRLKMVKNQVTRLV